MRSDTFVQKIWSLCHILRDDGITYYQYVSELSYLLFLKIAEETDSEHLLPTGCRWSSLEGHPVKDLLGFYQEMLTHLGAASENEVVKAIYAFPTTVFNHSENLKAVVDGISRLDWHEVGHDRFGQIYSGLVDKSAQDSRSSAGQYFTPRPLVDSMVRTIKPRPGELIQDPAAGSGGFLVSADQFLRREYSAAEYKANPATLEGVEIEKNTRRICLMNTFLHGLNARIIYGDALTDDAVLEPADVILANPPFGSKTGSKRPLRGDFSFPKCNKQLAFLQHIYNGLAEGGRAAVVLPDNVLFEGGIGKAVRRELMRLCDLHTILRLPAGIFTSASIKTNVLYFVKRNGSREATECTWFYDMRTDMPNFGRTLRLESSHFEEFEFRFGEDEFGKAKRTDDGDSGRFRRLTRDDIALRDDNLDIGWLPDSTASQPDGPASLRETADAVLRHLRVALAEVESMVDELPADDRVEEDE